jgi:hypothetical protein
MKSLKGFLLIGAILSLTFLVTSISYGHMDKDFIIDAHGNLKGLPSEYGPAYLKVSRTSNSNIPKVILRLGSKIIRIPVCLAKFFILPKSEKIIASGSW